MVTPSAPYAACIAVLQNEFQEENEDSEKEEKSEDEDDDEKKEAAQQERKRSADERIKVSRPKCITFLVTFCRRVLVLPVLFENEWRCLAVRHIAVESDR